jgi:N-glycosylase/DNA lyase
MSICPPGRFEVTPSVDELTNAVIRRRLQEFKLLGELGETVFDFNPFMKLRFRGTVTTELAFCISTANSSAKAGLRFQMLLESVDLKKITLEELQRMLKASGVRFYRRKSEYIKEALEHIDLFRVLEMDSLKARRFLVKNIKGMGWKEASHLLRNVGRFDVAIIDRHILRWLYENRLILSTPANLSEKNYLHFERLLKEIAENTGTTLGELDLVIWFAKTGMVLK